MTTEKMNIGTIENISPGQSYHKCDIEGLDEPEFLTLRGRLLARKRGLEKDLAYVNGTLEVLGNNPGIAKVLELVAKVEH